MSSLPSDFEPSQDDILCGRGKGSYNRAANKKFRSLVRQYLSEYTSARTRVDKSAVIDNILDRVQGNQTRFVTFKEERWFEISEDQAREKIGHCLREAIVDLQGAADRVQATKRFENKHSDLLLEQQAIFEALVREMNKNRNSSKPEPSLRLRHSNRHHLHLQ